MRREGCKVGCKKGEEGSQKHDAKKEDQEEIEALKNPTVNSADRRELCLSADVSTHRNISGGWVMNSIIYIVGLVVVVGLILSFFGLR